MSKNILIISGSPRKNGNTASLVQAFVDGAETSGHKISRFDAAANTVKGCIACRKCWSNGKACIFDDGFNELAPLLAAADYLVLASPLYWYGFSSQLKAALDKFYSFLMPATPAPLKIKGAGLLMVCGDEEQYVFDGAIATFRNIARYMKWEDLGIVTAFGVHEPGDISKTASLGQARKMGHELIG